MHRAKESAQPAVHVEECLLRACAVEARGDGESADRGTRYTCLGVTG